MQNNMLGKVILSVLSAIGIGLVGYEVAEHAGHKGDKPAAQVAGQPPMTLSPTTQVTAPVQPVVMAAPAPTTQVQQPAAAVGVAISPDQARLLPNGTQCTVTFRSQGGITLSSGRVLINSRPYQRGVKDPLQFTVTIPQGCTVPGRTTTGKQVTATGIVDEYNGSKQLRVDNPANLIVQ